MMEAELIPREEAEAEEPEADLPAPGEVTLESVWNGAKERAARAAGKVTKAAAVATGAAAGQASAKSSS
jgi:hypothetical protein